MYDEASDAGQFRQYAARAQRLELRRLLMSSHRIVLILASVLTLGAPRAHAFFDAPWIAPAAPMAGELMSVNIRGGICDVFFDAPGYPQIVLEGNNIRVIEYGHHEDFQDFCIYGLWKVVVPIGTPSAGVYTITVDFLYQGILGPTTTNLGVIPLTVTGVASAAPIPAFTSAAEIVLRALISSAALWSLRVHDAGNATGQIAQYAARAQRLGDSADC